MIGLLRMHLWRLWGRLRARVAAARRERAIRLIARAMDTADWEEFLIRQEAADEALEMMIDTGLATGDEKADERQAWEIARRLRQLHVESQRGKGARAP